MRWTSSDPEVRRVVGACVTLSVAVGVFGVSFGVGAVTSGATVLQTCAMSALVFTGASQFSAVSVIGAGGSVAAALGGALVLAARNAVYGLAMSRLLHGSLPTRLLAAQLTIDETTAMSAAEAEPRMKRIAFWVTGAALFTFWNLGTLIGALAGSVIDPQTFGLDAAFPAAFIAMAWSQLGDRRGRLAALLGATICLVLIPIAPIGVPILCASLAALVGLPPRPVTPAAAPEGVVS